MKLFKGVGSALIIILAGHLASQICLDIYYSDVVTRILDIIFPIASLSLVAGIVLYLFSLTFEKLAAPLKYPRMIAKFTALFGLSFVISCFFTSDEKAHPDTKALDDNVAKTIRVLNLTEEDRACSDKLKTAIQTKIPDTVFVFTEDKGKCWMKPKLSFRVLTSTYYLVTVSKDGTKVENIPSEQ